jgi:hypothetical protein
MAAGSPGNGRLERTGGFEVKFTTSLMIPPCRLSAVKDTPMNSPLPSDDSLLKTDDWVRPVERKSVHMACIEEENRHKWIESQKAGCDLGEACIREWVKRHWLGYLRARWVEHLQGKQFWIELDRGDFGLLQRKFIERKDLLDSILDQLKSGKENLHVIFWAVTNSIPTDSVHEILEALDVNSRRLQHRFETP